MCLHSINCKTTVVPAIRYNPLHLLVDHDELDAEPPNPQLKFDYMLKVEVVRFRATCPEMALPPKGHVRKGPYTDRPPYGGWNTIRARSAACPEVALPSED